MSKINLSILIRYSLGLVILIGTSCSDKEEPSQKEERIPPSPMVVYLVDPQMELSRNYSQELDQVFDYNKIPYSIISIQDFNNDPYLTERVKVLYINNTEPLSADSKELLLEFVGLGGTLIFPSLNEDQEAGYLSGLKSDVPLLYNVEDKGLSFRSNIFPGVQGRSIYPLKANYSFTLASFRENVNVLATSASNAEHPTIVEFSIGNGRVFHFNTNIPFEKQDRGLLFAPALKGLQGLPYPVANVSTIMIDDFPNPLYDIESQPIKSELDIDQSEFVLDVWWPDMLAISNKYGIEYSVYPCFNYDTIKQPPFVFREWDRHRTTKNNRQVISSNWLMKQVRENEFELAIHGYNHESLMLDVWDDREDMENALAATRKKWKVNGFGPYPKTYVPPSNDIDSVGLVALANAMPEMEFMCSIYDGELMEGGGREYDVDPLEPRLFDFPRGTSGYTFDDFKIYNQESIYLFTGIWSHFIHPDDVYQLPDSTNTSAGDYGYRNADRLGWYDSPGEKKGMFEYWNDYLELVTKLHPSTRFLNVYDGATITRDWRNSEYEFASNGSLYNVTKISTNRWANREFYWNLFIDKGDVPKIQIDLEKNGYSFTKTAMLGGSLFTVKTTEPSLKFSEGINLKNRGEYSLSEVYAQVKSENDQYKLERNAFVEPQEFEGDSFVSEPEPVVEDSVEWFVANENLSATTDMLLERLKPQIKMDSSAFNQFALYLAYQDRALEVWNFLEDIYQNKSTELALAYVDYYLTLESFPTAELNELWLKRKIENQSGNIELVKEYLAYFYSQEYQTSVKEMLLNLRGSNNSPEAYALYIQYLIDFEPELLPEELEGKYPEDYPSLEPKATTITYAYFDEGRLQEALVWADYSDEITIITILQWWIDLEAFNKMETVFLNYIKENPLDYEAMELVSNAWYNIGEYERGALIADRIPETDSAKVEFKKLFNTDVSYFEPDVQKYLMVNTPEVFYSDTLYALRSQLRFNENGSIAYNTNYVIDNFNQSVWDNTVSYNFKSEKLNEHNLSVTYSDVSDLVLNSFDANNVPHSLYGFQYKYQTRQNTEKPIFYALAGLERDDVSNIFATLGAGISISNDKNFKSLSYLFSPVKTGPAISREIYWGQLIGYYESGYNKTFQTSLSPVLTHYTTGDYERALTGRFFYNTKQGTGSRFAPFAEAFVSASNRLQEDGNPFWIIDQRFYGGGGLAWTLGQDQSRELYIRAEFGAFYDSYTESFLRFTGNFSFPIKQHTYITGQFEFFNQALYYSNGFQFGIKHFFKRRKEYAYKPRDYDDWYDE